MAVTYSTIDRIAFDLVPEVGHLPYAFVRLIIQKHLNNARIELIKVAFADCDIALEQLKREEENNEQSCISKETQHDNNNLHQTPHEVRDHGDKKRTRSCQIFKFLK